MGCGGSKLEDDYQHQTLVKLCRERKHLLKSAADHRFSLAAAHVAYFAHLSSVGDTLWRFVEEELVLVTSSPSSSSSISSLSSPVLTIPSDDFKKKKKPPPSKAEDHGGDNDHDHLHWSSSGEDEHVEHDHQHGHRKKAAAAAAAEGGGKGKKGRSRGEIEPSSLPSPQPGISYIPDPGPPPPYYSFDPSTSYGYPSANAYGDYGNYGNAGFSGNFSNYGNNSGFNAYSNPNYPPQYGTGGYYSGNYDYDNYNNDSNNTGTGTGTSYGFGSNTGNGTTYTSYYMKKSSTRIPSVFYEQPKHVNNPIYSYNDGSQNVVNHREDRQQQQQQQMKGRPPTPPSPKVSAWDYFNPFESFESGGVGVGVGGGDFYGGEQQPGMYGYGGGGGYESNSSSPDSREVREREGIPDLEEETETEVSFPMSNTKKVAPQKGNRTVHFQDHVHEIPVKNKGSRGNTNTNNVRNISSNAGNFHKGSSKRRPFVEQEPELEALDEEREVEGSSFSPETEASVGTLSSSGEDHEHDHFHEHELEEEKEKEQERVYVKKKGVSFEVEGSVGPSHEVQSSMPSSLTTLSADVTRDLREVVREIKDEFEAATDYGKEVSTLLEVGREPYRSRSTFLKVMLAKMCSTSLSSFHSPSGATGYPEELNSRSLASTLDKLYVWEKKLYKEVKDEEKLRLMYEKQCKKLKTLDEQGAETSKIEATQFSIRKLLTKINVSVRAVDFISNRIHKLRDEELQPQLKELVYGLRKMWKLMLKCHQKQFQAILESKTRALRANTGLRKDSSVRATIQLEAELLKWGQHFNNWIEMQRSYAKTLNRWLERCIQYEPEETADGVMPFSPGRIGAPPVFVICHDWKQAMERVSESQVQTAMNDFASSLHQLWERQDEEQRRRLKADNIYTDFEKQIRAIRVERQRKGHEHDDALSDKNSLSIVASDSGISPLDDLKVDLDSMRQRVREERAGHKEAIKLVHDAVSRSIQAGLIPIFESLESFTSDASKALDDVRLEHVTVS